MTSKLFGMLCYPFERGLNLRALGVLFLAYLSIIGVGFSLGALLAMPLIPSAIHGALYFSVSSSELCSSDSGDVLVLTRTCA